MRCGRLCGGGIGTPFKVDNLDRGTCRFQSSSPTSSPTSMTTRACVYGQEELAAFTTGLDLHGYVLAEDREAYKALLTRKKLFARLCVCEQDSI